jgi:hypothetical protein
VGIAAGDGKLHFLPVFVSIASQSEMSGVAISDEGRVDRTTNEAYIANSGDGPFLLLDVI